MISSIARYSSKTIAQIVATNCDNLYIASHLYREAIVGIDLIDKDIILEATSGPLPYIDQYQTIAIYGKYYQHLIQEYV